MSSNLTPGQSPLSLRGDVKKLSKGLADMAQYVERVVKSLVAGITRNSKNVESIGSALDEIGTRLQAIANLVGVEQVDAEEDRLVRLAGETSIAREVEKGNLALADVSSEKSLLVGTPYDADGKTLRPGRIQIPVLQFKEEFRASLVGKKAGDEVPFGTGKLVLTEIYKETVKPLETVPEQVDPTEPAAETPADKDGE